MVKRHLSVSLAILLVMTVPVSRADIAISNTQNLAFGSFVAGSGGTITVNNSDMRSTSGGVMLIPISEGTAARFTVSGDPNTTYAIQLPADNFVTLTGPGTDMVINNFTSNPSAEASGQIGAGGTQILSVGATLNVQTNQSAGEYTGSFTVIVDYN